MMAYLIWQLRLAIGTTSGMKDTVEDWFVLSVLMKSSIV